MPQMYVKVILSVTLMTGSTFGYALGRFVPHKSDGISRGLPNDLSSRVNVYGDSRASVNVSLENIALLKPTWQYAEYSSRDGRFHASNAVDGLKSNLSALGGQCVVSANERNSATWLVDLKSILSIHHITIYYRTDNSRWDRVDGYNTRFLGFYVYISNTTNKNDGILCYHDTNYTKSTIPPVINIRCLFHGRYVIYYNERPQYFQPSSEYSQYAYNELCEVEVYGCPIAGFYGSNCSIPCADNCGNGYCHIENGKCYWCKPGYKGPYCKHECDGRKYGQDCEESCGACLGYKQCHHINGSCLESCDSGYKGELCTTGCFGWKFGINCEEYCNKNCGVQYKCNSTTGQCEGGCQPGWEGPKCDQVCSRNKFGENCTHLCGFCRYSPCHHLNGSCLGECAEGYRECEAGFYGYKCKQECSLFCKTSRDCNHVTGYCNDGCIGGWQGAKCLQVAEKMVGLEWSSRFYAVLAALCVCITIIVLLIVYICYYRRRTNKRLKKQKFKGNNEAGKVDLGVISCKIDEDESRRYQELGQHTLPSDYDYLR